MYGQIAREIIDATVKYIFFGTVYTLYTTLQGLHLIFKNNNNNIVIFIFQFLCNVYLIHFNADLLDQPESAEQVGLSHVAESREALGGHRPIPATTHTPV